MLIGKQMKALRKARGMKLIELAQATGIQIASLSRIEHDRMTGTLPSHIKIAEALGVELTELYQDLVKPSKTAPEAVDGHSSTETFTFNDKASYEILVANLMAKKMMPVMMRIEAGGASSEEQNRAGSERFLFMLEGTVIAHIDGKKFTLEKNNALYFNAADKHWFENTGTVTARFISVISPVAL